MISFATDKDKKRIIDLWCEIFGDSKESVGQFLVHFPCEKALGYYSDGRLVAFMFLPELKLRFKGEHYRANYIYALCTDKAFRSQGIGSELIESSRRYSAENGIPYTLIRPSSDSLFEYYYSNGFEREYHRIKKNLTIDGNLLYNSLDNDLVAFAQWGSDGLSYSSACGIADEEYAPCANVQNGERYLMLRRNSESAVLFDNVYMGLTFE